MLDYFSDLGIRSVSRQNKQEHRPVSTLTKLWLYFSKKYTAVEMSIRQRFAPLPTEASANTAGTVQFNTTSQTNTTENPSIRIPKEGIQHHNARKENILFFNSESKASMRNNKYTYNYLDDHIGTRRLNIVNSDVFKIRSCNRSIASSEKNNESDIRAANFLVNEIAKIDTQEKYSSINIIEYVSDKDLQSFNKNNPIPSHTPISQEISSKLKMPVVYNSLMKDVIEKNIVAESFGRASVGSQNSALAGLYNKGTGCLTNPMMEGPRVSLAGAEFASPKFNSDARRNSPAVLQHARSNTVALAERG